MSTILYIENDQDHSAFVKKMLEAQGHDVLWAVDGPHGLEMAQTCQPDLIILEMNLPGMNGKEVVQHLRVNPQDRLFAVPVMALTTSAEPGAALDVFAAGCDFYLAKPVSPGDLQALVGEALQWRRQPGI